jgi:hypothetical protein
MLDRFSLQATSKVRATFFTGKAKKCPPPVKVEGIKTLENGNGKRETG